MKLKLNYSLLAPLLLILCQPAYSQTSSWRFKRELSGVEESWHRLEFPDEVFAMTKSDHADLRIIGIREDGDSVTVPYILNVLQEETSKKTIPFEILNQSRQENRYYFTLEIPTSERINRIHLQFREKNFDRIVKLEGGQEPGKWFTILDEYRILSISNISTTYEFTTLHFPASRYRYYRLSFNSAQKPELTEATISSEQIIPGSYRTYKLSSKVIREDKEKGETIVDLQLPLEVPVSYLALTVEEAYDFYRPLTIQYLADSVETTKGWRYSYKTLVKGVLSSLEENSFQFPNTKVRRLRLRIQNGDNPTLSIGKITVKGNVHELTARFPEAAQYFLLYGNPSAPSPNFDLAAFKDKIPKNLSLLAVGEEQILPQEEPVVASPLFQDQRWLWGIMGVVILLLGWFSLRMMRRV